MMKRMSRYSRAGRILALLLCALLLTGMLPSFGALGASKKKNTATGSLTVTLKTDPSKLPDGARVEITLYQIGTPAPQTAAGWSFEAPFDKVGAKIIAAKRSSDLQTVASDLAEDIVNGDYHGKKMNLSSGSKKLSGLAQGVYIGVWTRTPAGFEANPFIVTIPSWNADKTSLLYDIVVNDKDTYTEPTPTPTTIVTATPTPTTEVTATPTPTSKVTATPTPTSTPVPTTPPGGGGGGGVPVPPGPTPTPTTDISGTKIWDDDGNVHKVRPGSIQITLYANGSPVNAQPSWSKRGDRWTYTFSGLPKLDSSGREIAYTVSETPVSMYESTVSGLTITNKLIPKEPEQYIDLSGEKIWKDDNNARGKRPTTITVRLLRDGVEIESRTVTAGTNWKYTFQHLPVDDGYGNVYTYEVREDGVSGYFSRIDGMTLINSLIDGVPPTTPTGGGETPPPNGTTPNVPQRPEDVPERKTGTLVPHFEEMDDEELEELFDMFGYGTPLYGMFGTGDQIPFWVWLCGGVGILALVMAIALGRKKKKNR